MKIDGSVREEKSSFEMLGLTFSSKFDWGSYIVTVAKIATSKMGVLIRSMKFLSPEVALYLYRNDKLQKWICRTFGPSPAASLEPIAHH